MAPLEEQVELGTAPSLADGIAATVEYVLESSGLQDSGPWQVDAESHADVALCTITLTFTISPMPRFGGN